MTHSNLTELERRVTDLLHHDAENAMRATDTERQYQDLIDSSGSPWRWGQPPWVVGAAAAAVLVIALLLAALLGGSSDRAPVPPTTERTPVQVADDFMDAISAYDTTRASRDLAEADGVSLHLWPGEPSLGDGLAWAKAIGYQILPRQCAAQGGVATPQPPGITRVICPIDYVPIAAERLNDPALEPPLGDAPYTGAIEVDVANGRIVSANDNAAMGWYVWGFRDVRGGTTEKFKSWLLANHRADLPVMVQERDAVEAGFWAPIWTKESYRLWARYVNEYVHMRQAEAKYARFHARFP